MNASRAEALFVSRGEDFKYLGGESPNQGDWKIWDLVPVATGFPALTAWRARMSTQTRPVIDPGEPDIDPDTINIEYLELDSDDDDDVICLREKIDGVNGSFRLVDGLLVASCKGRRVTERSASFREFYISLTDSDFLALLNPSYIYLVTVVMSRRPNLVTYDRIPQDFCIGFGIWTTAGGCLEGKVVDEEFARIGLECQPIVGGVKPDGITWTQYAQQIVSQMNECKIPSVLGGVPAGVISTPHFDIIARVASRCRTVASLTFDQICTHRGGKYARPARYAACRAALVAGGVLAPSLSQMETALDAEFDARWSDVCRRLLAIRMPTRLWSDCAPIVRAAARAGLAAWL